MHPTTTRAAAALGLALLAAAATAQAQGTRERVQALESGFASLRFTPPAPRQVRLSNGVQVFLIEDHSLPQLSVRLVGRQGVANLPDSLWAVGWQADALLRTGGT
ncbi:MAG: hypothetical protein Q8Q85_09345, partial [Gemmatimonadales bacterium]|nr:hypothetical protein [Gemmatimonadales bacterium]